MANAASPPRSSICRTVIGKGSPNRAGTAKAHGEALGADEIAATRRELGWSEPPFVIPADLYAAWDATQVGAERHARWQDAFAAYAAAYPEEAAELERACGACCRPTGKTSWTTS